MYVYIYIAYVRVCIVYVYIYSMYSVCIHMYISITEMSDGEEFATRDPRYVSVRTVCTPTANPHTAISLSISLSIYISLSLSIYICIYMYTYMNLHNKNPEANNCGLPLHGKTANAFQRRTCLSWTPDSLDP